MYEIGLNTKFWCLYFIYFFHDCISSCNSNDPIVKGVLTSYNVE